MITCEIYESGLLRKSWKFRFIGANGRKLGHDYNTLENARESVQTLVSPNISVRLQVRHRDGTVQDLGWIR